MKNSFCKCWCHSGMDERLGGTYSSQRRRRTQTALRWSSWQRLDTALYHRNHIWNRRASCDRRPRSAHSVTSRVHVYSAPPHLNLSPQQCCEPTTVKRSITPDQEYSAINRHQWWCHLHQVVSVHKSICCVQHIMETNRPFNGRS